MAAWGYELYLLVLKVFLTSELREWAPRVSSAEKYFQHEKIKFVSPSGHVISSIPSLKYLSPACNLQNICANHYVLKHGMVCIYSIFKINPSSYIMLSTKNAVKFFKPFCCLLLLSDSSRPFDSTIEVELGELLKQLRKWRKEGE